MRVHIAPTYRCNLDCEYCYARAFAHHFPDDLHPTTYSRILDDLSPRGLTSVSFIGGEPTLWPHLPAAMERARQMGLRRLLYTNGTAASAAPDTVVLNMSRFMRGDVSRGILESLRWYHSNDCTLVFRFNISRDGPEARSPQLVSLARALNADISIAAVHTSPHERELGKRLFDWCARFLDASLKVAISRPLPLCMLTDYQRRFLELNCDLRATCDLDTAVPVVNPDGRTIFPCNSIAIGLPLSYVYQSHSDFDQIRALRSRESDAMPLACRNCDHYLQRTCRAGCPGAWNGFNALLASHDPSKSLEGPALKREERFR
jgi:sulfatase maturation enzyme AslB (radical SAM superfamily)